MALNRSDSAVLALSAAFVISQANIARVLGTAGPKVLKIQTALSARAYNGVLATMDDDEIRRYRSHFGWDMVHPLIYAAALDAGARRLSQSTPMSPALRKVLVTAPWMSAAGDYVENVVGLYLLDHRQHVSDASVRAVSGVSIAKWTLALGSFAYLAQGFGRVALRACRD
ncbi:hypothetical protein G4X40_01995 [Rhodococcus sp. D2-41]|uniref:Uncharacterized protein n=1 Tax=Speluncibacter jeojiensis TaxID=2710754 RepID=A0A9X4RFQ7_9ACTN|nr:hypothetical protein [Rhodococcus sp. D2-41]MDG3008915.1 hypothetical protein [Rhodococcus sp. D2-41]MDG3016537.1 hypothetical protein [Corynebacteriales bacterium D3-21]